MLEKDQIEETEVNGMKVMPVSQAEYTKLEDYLERNEKIDARLLANKGYVVEIGGGIEASFVLEEIELNNFWLKQLYITQAHAAKLPVLLETILQIAKSKDAGAVYVHSHQPVVDILLEALKFKREEKEELFSLKPDVSGSWWGYHVS
jgi:hypothetical protein